MKIRGSKTTQVFICTVCPLGCVLTVKARGTEVRGVSGHRCPRGPVYAAEEISGPKRVVTTTVRLDRGRIPLLPVKTAGPVPRDRGRDVVIAAARITARAPVALGDVVAEDIASTGVALVATRSVESGSEVS